MTTIEYDDLKKVLGAKQAQQIIDQVEAANAEELSDADIEAAWRFLDREKLGKGDAYRVARVLREYYRVTPNATSRIMAWLNKREEEGEE